MGCGEERATQSQPHSQEPPASTEGTCPLPARQTDWGSGEGPQLPWLLNGASDAGRGRGGRGRWQSGTPSVEPSVGRPGAHLHLQTAASAGGDKQL